MLSNQSHLVDVIVRDKPVTKFSHEGDTYIEGRPNSPYIIKIRNPSYRRMKAVISVDGLSIMDGKPASENSGGYVIGGYQTIEIDGWRLSNSTAAQFVFGSKKTGYSNQSGYGTTNVGVIGVLLFEEYQAPQPFRPMYMHQSGTIRSFTGNPTWMDNSFSQTSSMSSAPKGMSIGSIEAMAMNAAMPVSASASLNNLGTQFGQDISSKVSEVDFITGNQYAQIVIYYDDRKGLEARGIVVDPRKNVPDPFPASSQYCKRPNQTRVI